MVVEVGGIWIINHSTISQGVMLTTGRGGLRSINIDGTISKDHLAFG